MPFHPGVKLIDALLYNLFHEGIPTLHLQRAQHQMNLCLSRFDREHNIRAAVPLFGALAGPLFKNHLIAKQQQSV
jgi:hypothetical protein